MKLFHWLLRPIRAIRDYRRDPGISTSEGVEGFNDGKVPDSLQLEEQLSKPPKKLEK